ncbi:MAG: carbon monoxide dehydrogenase [Variovorax paradoxus]|uniref:Carbon monoxide dehydrogenase n=1 Tax=Variovorax paradoxus TaxID=34073 RepID=A0A2W5QM15_VARPD|nr:MAG: carbon monoxide dehydrogenase [Variovorax paradoxus]
MKYEQSFQVAQNIATVWNFFSQFDRVAWCMPGLQKADVIDADSLDVVLSQRVGPMTATFQARVQITERVEQQSMGFTSIGKAVRGAIGNFRSTNSVTLASVDDGRATAVTVTGEVALGGALGSLGQKVVAKQAEKMTAEFAKQLERVLSEGDDKKVAAESDASPANDAAKPTPSTGAAQPSAQAAGAAQFASPRSISPAQAPLSEGALLFWARLTALGSLGTFTVGLALLWRLT